MMLDCLKVATNTQTFKYFVRNGIYKCTELQIF